MGRDAERKGADGSSRSRNGNDQASQISRFLGNHQEVRLAPAVGFEPTTNGLTVRCATAAPRRNSLCLQEARYAPLSSRDPGEAGAAGEVGGIYQGFDGCKSLDVRFCRERDSCSLRACLLWSTRRDRGIRPGWPRGGVVTQRTANPCTPVRFRARPPPFFRRHFHGRFHASAPDDG